MLIMISLWQCNLPNEPVVTAIVSTIAHQLDGMVNVGVGLVAAVKDTLLIG